MNRLFINSRNALRNTCTLTVFILYCLLPLPAEESNQIEISAFSGDINIDGILNDPLWQTEPDIENLDDIFMSKLDRGAGLSKESLDGFLLAVRRI